MGVAAILVLAGPVGQADAVVTGLARVTPFTASTSAPKSLTATCPAGTRVIGPGGDTTPGNGSVVLNQIRPDASLTSVTVHADEDEVGTPSNWFLQAFVICAAPPTGLELVSATSANTSANKSVVAACPSGKRLLGNGAEITGAAGQVLLDGQLPNAQVGDGDVPGRPARDRGRRRDQRRRSDPRAGEPHAGDGPPEQRADRGHGDRARDGGGHRVQAGP